MSAADAMKLDAVDGKLVCAYHTTKDLGCPLCVACEFVETLKGLLDHNTKIVAAQTEVINALLSGDRMTALDRLGDCREAAARAAEYAATRKAQVSL